MKKCYFILISFLFLFTSCEKEEDCSYTYLATISSVDAPETAEVNAPVSIDVFYGTTDGCQFFNRFITSTKDNEIEIALEIRSEGCLCTQVALGMKETLEFTLETPGDYLLKFKKGNTFIEVPLVVN